VSRENDVICLKPVLGKCITDVLNLVTNVEFSTPVLSMCWTLSKGITFVFSIQSTVIDIQIPFVFDKD